MTEPVPPVLFFIPTDAPPEWEGPLDMGTYSLTRCVGGILGQVLDEGVDPTAWPIQGLRLVTEAEAEAEALRTA